MSTPEERLADLGLSVPEVAKPVAAYVPALRSGNHVFTSGQLPMRDGELMLTGKVGGEVTQEEAVECARQCALNALAAVRAEVGELSAVKRIVKVVAFVASTPDFTGQPLVANGVSELLGEVFGEAGRHARSAVGVDRAPARLAGRGRAGGRGLMVRVQLPPQLVEDAQAYADGSREPAEPRNAATVVLMRRGRAGTRGLPAAPADLDGLRRRDVRLPGRGGRPARLRPRTWPGPARRRRSGPPASAPTRPPPGHWSVPRSARRSRSRVSCWPGSPATPSSRTPPARTGRPTGQRSRPASCPSPTSSTGAGWCCAPTCSGSGPGG